MDFNIKISFSFFPFFLFFLFFFLFFFGVLIYCFKTGSLKLRPALLHCYLPHLHSAGTTGIILSWFVCLFVCLFVCFCGARVEPTAVPVWPWWTSSLLSKALFPKSKWSLPRKHPASPLPTDSESTAVSWSETQWHQFPSLILTCGCPEVSCQRRPR